MASPGGSRLRTTFALAGLLLLAVPGFAFGLFAGVAWREPDLVASHFFGETRELAESASAPAAGAEASGDVAAAPPSAAPAPPAPADAKRGPQLGAGPAPAPAAPAQQAALAPGSERLAVQVGAFGDAASADALVARLKRKGYPAFVSPSGGEAAGARWRVRVGPLASRDAAERAAARLKAEERLPTWVVDDARS